MSDAHGLTTARLRQLAAGERQTLAAARLLAARRCPYLATALFALDPVAAPQLDTLAVDRRWRLYVGPVALERWSPTEIAGVLVHEVGHLIRGHADRGGRIGVSCGGTHLEWNLACDAAINDDLLAEGIRLPSGCITPASLDAPEHLLEEDYYSRLVARTRRQRTSGNARSSPAAPADCGSGADGRPRAWDIADDDHAEGVPRHAQEIIRRTVTATIKARGNAPAGWRRWADEHTAPPQVDWRRMLRRAIRTPRAYGPGTLEPTWSRVSRRDDQQDPILRAGRWSPRLEIGVVIDTSASMTDAELSAVLTEIRAVQRHSDARRIWVVTCDAVMAEPQRVSRPGQIRLVGGGGTDLRPAIVAMTTLRPRPDVVVVCTDGLTPWPATAPDTFALVVATTDRPCPTPGVENVSVEL